MRLDFREGHRLFQQYLKYTPEQWERHWAAKKPCQSINASQNRFPVGYGSSPQQPQHFVLETTQSVPGTSRIQSNVHVPTLS